MKGIKEQWINDVMRLLEQEDPNMNGWNEDYSYQLACAYFDWNADGHPDCTPEEAFSQYILNRSYRDYS